MRKIKNFVKWLPLLVLLLTVSCRSSKSLTDTAAGGGADRQTEAYFAKILNNAQRAKCVTGRMDLQLNALGNNLSVSGQLRMKRDEVVQLSLTLLGFEVGRLEFAPGEVLIIDRVNKQFVRAPYSDVSFLQAAGLDFYALQALFWNELFIPGQRDVRQQLKRFGASESGSHTQLTITDAPKLDYSFLTQTAEAIINQVIVTAKEGETPAKMVWTYDKFTQLDGRLFPTTMSCQVEGLGKTAGFSFTLSRVNNESGWTTRTTVSSRYQERKADEILKRLLSM